MIEHDLLLQSVSLVIPKSDPKLALRCHCQKVNVDIVLVYVIENIKVIKKLTACASSVMSIMGGTS